MENKLCLPSFCLRLLYFVQTFSNSAKVKGVSFWFKTFFSSVTSFSSLSFLLIFIEMVFFSMVSLKLTILIDFLSSFSMTILSSEIGSETDSVAFSLTFSTTFSSVLGCFSACFLTTKVFFQQSLK